MVGYSKLKRDSLLICKDQSHLLIVRCYSGKVRSQVVLKWIRHLRGTHPAIFFFFYFDTVRNKIGGKSNKGKANNFFCRFIRKRIKLTVQFGVLTISSFFRSAVKRTILSFPLPPRQGK